MEWVRIEEPASRWLRRQSSPGLPQKGRPSWITSGFTRSSGYDSVLVSLSFKETESEIRQLLSDCISARSRTGIRLPGGDESLEQNIFVSPAKVAAVMSAAAPRCRSFLLRMEEDLLPPADTGPGLDGLFRQAGPLCESVHRGFPVRRIGGQTADTSRSLELYHQEYPRELFRCGYRWVRLQAA